MPPSLKHPEDEWEVFPTLDFTIFNVPGMTDRQWRGLSYSFKAPAIPKSDMTYTAIWQSFVKEIVHSNLKFH